MCLKMQIMLLANTSLQKVKLDEVVHFMLLLLRALDYRNACTTESIGPEEE